ncbi:hypothetical protein NP233_g8772 [Leucocoprinus birnbaumii]|uniref:Nephrocystin 3-like N-terminal domain-containing protein n=1 Tax=Leucocoprinus birnbaumii TaxID=56174 RepID=A0AAD5YTE9_9AGAR|nr:hypothetical protein NP233_g8772 [Leucocoprinus birnbaumii]
MLLPALRSLWSRFTLHDTSLSTTNHASSSPSLAPVNNTPHRQHFFQDHPANTRYTATSNDQPPGLFSNAQHFVINNPNIISQIIHSGTAVIHLLAEKRLAGAEFNSSERDPPPRCHPDTRHSLRTRIRGWFHNPQRPWKMLWVLGPAGVGKTAVAQTIAEEFRALGHLGASFFFSRSNHWNDPDRVIPTLAYQLAIRHAGYKRLITERLANDPGVLNASRSFQFKELIVEPFHELTSRGYHEPLLIIIDGLDECQGENAQIELIELISHYVETVQGPLLWMICSRPEWHFKRELLSRVDFHVACLREELNVDDPESQKDVFSFLRASFDRIRERYRDRLGPHWPSERDFQRIVMASSGHFAFSSTLTRFIGDKNQGDPERQLNICLDFLNGSTSGRSNPFHALDMLYTQILSNIPIDNLPTTMRILGFCIFYPHYYLSAQSQANFLCLDRIAFRRALEHLHSVIDVPTASESLHKSIHFYHASFGEFLRQPDRSSSYALVPSMVHFDVASHSLKWNQRAIASSRVQRDLRHLQFPELKWIEKVGDQDDILTNLSHFSMIYGWEAITRAAPDHTSALLAQLEDFGLLRDV